MLKHLAEIHLENEVEPLRAVILMGVCSLIRDPKALPNPDLLDVDYFLYYVLTAAEREELERIRREASALKHLSDKLIYWDVMEVARVNELIEELMSTMQKLGLTKL